MSGVGKWKGRASIPGRRTSVSKGTEVGMSRACVGDRKEAGLCWVAVEDSGSQQDAQSMKGI